MIKRGRPTRHSATASGAASLGERLRIARGDSTREQAAADLDTNKATLGYYERDERDPPASLLAKACRKYNVEPAWLLLGRGPQFAELPKAAVPLAYNAEKMQVALLIADELDKAGRLPPNKEKHVWATQLYEFFMQQD